MQKKNLKKDTVPYKKGTRICTYHFGPQFLISKIYFCGTEKYTFSDICGNKSVFNIQPEIQLTGIIS